MKLKDTRLFMVGDQPGVSGQLAVVIEACAHAAHEAERAFCAAIGSNSRRPWLEAPELQRESMRLNVDAVLAGSTDEKQHEHYCASMAEKGWVYGPVMDPEKKTHPILVPYAELSEASRRNSDLCQVVMWAMVEILSRDNGSTSTLSVKTSQVRTEDKTIN